MYPEKYRKISPKSPYIWISNIFFPELSSMYVLYAYMRLCAMYVCAAMTK